jgi:hypothetical protein
VWCCRWRTGRRGEHRQPLTAANIAEGRAKWTKLEQAAYFPEERAAQERERRSWHRCTPYMNYDEILRVGGRLHQLAFPFLSSATSFHSPVPIYFGPPSSGEVNNITRYNIVNWTIVSNNFTFAFQPFSLTTTISFWIVSNAVFPLLIK